MVQSTETIVRGRIAHLGVAPLPERPSFRVALRDMGHAPVGLCDQAQLLERLVPRGVEGIEVEPNLWGERATWLSGAI